VAALVPRIEQLADELIAAMPTTGPVDLLAAFAFPLPITVICELLGIPVTDRDQFRTWTNTILFAGSAGPEPRQAAAADMNAYLRALIAARRAHPGDDMLWSGGSVLSMCMAMSVPVAPGVDTSGCLVVMIC